MRALSQPAPPSRLSQPPAAAPFPAVCCCPAAVISARIDAGSDATAVAHICACGVPSRCKVGARVLRVSPAVGTVWPAQGGVRHAHTSLGGGAPPALPSKRCHACAAHTTLTVPASCAAHTGGRRGGEGREGEGDGCVCAHAGTGATPPPMQAVLPAPRHHIHQLRRRRTTSGLGMPAVFFLGGVCVCGGA